MNPDPNKPMDDAEDRFWRRLRLDQLPDELDPADLEERATTGGESPLSDERIAEMVAQATGESEVVEDDDGAPPIRSMWAWVQNLNSAAAAGIAAALLLSAGIVVYQFFWKAGEERVDDFRQAAQALDLPTASERDQSVAFGVVYTGVTVPIEVIKLLGKDDLESVAEQALAAFYAQFDARDLIVNPEYPEGHNIRALTAIVEDSTMPLDVRSDAIRKLGEEARRGLTCAVSYSRGPMAQDSATLFAAMIAVLERLRDSD